MGLARKRLAFVLLVASAVAATGALWRRASELPVNVAQRPHSPCSDKTLPKPPPEQSSEELSQITGRVVDEDGLPVEGVILASQQNGRSGNQPTRSDARGQFVLSAWPGKNIVSLYRRYLDGALEQIAPATDVTFVLKKGVPVLVHVTDESGKPFPGASVWAYGDSQTSDSSGNAVFKSVPPGLKHVSANPHRKDMVGVSKAVEVPEKGELRVELQFKLLSFNSNVLTSSAANWSMSRVAPLKHSK
jgi:hypothetical protein